jgi:hypothetical protein
VLGLADWQIPGKIREGSLFFKAWRVFMSWTIPMVAENHTSDALSACFGFSRMLPLKTGSCIFLQVKSSSTVVDFKPVRLIQSTHHLHTLDLVTEISSHLQILGFPWIVI